MGTTHGQHAMKPAVFFQKAQSGFFYIGLTIFVQESSTITIGTGSEPGIHRRFSPAVYFSDDRHILATNDYFVS
jgi:hypothetical protein